jgi:FecR protein
MSAPRRPPLLPIEPLGEERWRDFDRGLFAALDGDASPLAGSEPRPGVRASRRSSGAVLASVAAAAAVVLALVGGWHLGARGGSPQSSSPTRIVSGASPSHLALGDNELDLGADTAVVAIGDDEHGVFLVVERGSVVCTVAPRGARPPFVVQAGDVRVRVVGTRFSVTRLDEGARVEVDHGVVEVSAGSDRLTLRDGQSWGTSTPARSADPSSASPIPAKSSVELAAAPPAVVEPTSSAAGAASSRLPSPRDRFEIASHLERTEPGRAIALYAQLAAGGGSWGANALFAEARLEADRGRHEEARRLGAQYLSRFPNGPNAADARVLVGGN